MNERSETAGEWGFQDLWLEKNQTFEGWESWDRCEAAFHQISDTLEYMWATKATGQTKSLLRCGIQ